jgi:hypothetical protein
LFLVAASKLGLENSGVQIMFGVQQSHKFLLVILSHKFCPSIQILALLVQHNQINSILQAKIAAAHHDFLGMAGKIWLTI